MTIDELTDAIRSAWCAETSADPAWTAENPALGQCVVSALVVQDHLGGELLRAVVGDVSHYWNRVGQVEIDLTREQFAEFSPRDIAVRDREYVLSFPDTRRRYELLTGRIAADGAQ